MLLGSFLERLGEIDVRQHGRDQTAYRRVRVDDAQQGALSPQDGCRRTPSRNGERRAVSVRRVPDRGLLVRVDDRVRQRPESGAQGSFPSLLRADQLAEQTERALLVTRYEAPARRLFQVLQPRAEHVAPIFMAPDRLFECVHRRRHCVAFAFELGAPFRQRRRLCVEALDVVGQAFAFAFGDRPTLPNVRNPLLEPRPFALVRRERASERLHLGATRRRLLEGAAPLLFDVQSHLGRG
jgi:hypothetical protein